MIRHENDLTNHRLMWLSIGQGLIANAYVGAGSVRDEIVSVLAPVGILVALSAFVILYKSYQARGYPGFLGALAKQGTLSEEKLPLFGWPAERVRDWRRNVWACPWLGRVSDLLEPYFFLPGLLILATGWYRAPFLMNRFLSGLQLGIIRSCYSGRFPGGSAPGNHSVCWSPWRPK